MKHLALAAAFLFVPASLALAQEAPKAPASAPVAAQPAGKAKAKPKLYDESADAKAQIAAALAKAQKNNTRVLIQWGGNWCSWCIRLHELYQSDKKIAKTLQYEYEVVMVDTGQPKGKNLEVAKLYGADVEKHGFPYLTILDSAGKPVANQETESLEVKNAAGESEGVSAGHNPEKVLKFLTDHQASHPEAKDVLAAGLKEAKSSGKRAFVHFGAPWCVWCHRLEDWMARPEVAAILSKEFVDIKIDTERTGGGEALLASFRKNDNSGGIPFFVFTDSEGATLADSNGPKGNIGFPAQPDELAHFESMLKKGAKSITPEEINKLIASLKEKPAAPAAHAPSSGN